MSVAIVGLVLGVVLAAQTQSKPILSPEVHSDHTVTFRLRSPNAKEVTVSVEGFDSAEMIRGDDGVWTYTTRALDPEIYGYGFSVDGNTVLDPQNPFTKPNLVWPSNAVLVPGDPPMPWEVQNVPHGELHHLFYQSKVIGDQRDLYVYTPPGYDPRGKTEYPVLYLLHGYSDMANGWSQVGMANVILDNLIAQDVAKPMVVVMPLGYGGPNAADPLRPSTTLHLPSNHMQIFVQGLTEEIAPMIEAKYRVKRDRGDRAVAGLSMGGSEAILAGLNHLDLFSYVGAFSAGGLGHDLASRFPGLTADAANQLKVLYISCGTSDGLITANRALVGWLQGQGVHVSAVETPGRHEWPVWRNNLIQFAGKIFK